MLKIEVCLSGRRQSPVLVKEVKGNQTSLEPQCIQFMHRHLASSCFGEGTAQDWSYIPTDSALRSYCVHLRAI